MARKGLTEGTVVAVRSAWPRPVLVGQQVTAQRARDVGPLDSEVLLEGPVDDDDPTAVIQDDKGLIVDIDERLKLDR